MLVRDTWHSQKAFPSNHPCRAPLSNSTPPVNPNHSEREEIHQRDLNFKAHPERFAREREEFAASLLKKMLERS
jgi:hypothetical protein